MFVIDISIGRFVVIMVIDKGEDKHNVVIDYNWEGVEKWIVARLSLVEGPSSPRGNMFAETSDEPLISELNS